MRRCLVFVVVCLVVLAGCGSEESVEPAGTVTPAPIPDGATPGSRSAQSLAPGVTTDGVVAPTRLVGAHSAVLRGRSFTTTRRALTYAADGSLRSTVFTRGAVSDDRRRLFVDRYASGPLVRSIGLSGRTEQYISGTTRLQRESRNDTVRYNRWRRDPGTITGSVLLSDLSASSTLSLAFHGMNFSVRPHPDPWSGDQYRLVSTAVTDPDTLVGLAGENARNVSFVATVTADGVVPWFRLSYTADRGDTSVRVVRTVTFEAIGTTTVERPSWYENATGNAAGSPTAPGMQTDRPADAADWAAAPSWPLFTPKPGGYASGVRSTTVPS